MGYWKYANGAIAGSALTYVALYALGYVPLWFGPESSDWSKDELGDEVMEELRLIEEEGYWKHRAVSSSRNFLEVHQSTPERRVRKKLYVDRGRSLLRGVIKFGADVEGPPRCVHGGCSAAVVDACLGVLAYKLSLLPCLTANLNINYRNKIPLGSAVTILCKLEKRDGRKLHLSFVMKNIAGDVVYLEGSALFVQAIVSFVS